MQPGKTVKLFSTVLLVAGTDRNLDLIMQTYGPKVNFEGIKQGNSFLDQIIYYFKVQ